MPGLRELCSSGSMAFAAAVFVIAAGNPRAVGAVDSVAGDAATGWSARGLSAQGDEGLSRRQACGLRWDDDGGAARTSGPGSGGSRPLPVPSALTPVT